MNRRYNSYKNILNVISFPQRNDFGRRNDPTRGKRSGRRKNAPAEIIT